MENHSSEVCKQKIDKINNLLKRINEERRDFEKNSVYFETIKEICDDRTALSLPVKSKVKKIVEEHEVSKFVRLPKEENCSDPKSHVLLGLTGLNKVELTYDESTELQQALKKKLLERHKELFKNVDKIGVAKACGSIINPIDPELIDLKKQFDKTNEEFVMNLEEIADLLEKLVIIRNKEFVDITKERADDLCLKAKLADLKSRLTMYKLKTCIFNDSKLTMNAFENVRRGIAKDSEQLNQDIEKLQKELHVLENLKSNPKLHELHIKFLDVTKSLDALKNVLQI